MNSTTVKNRDYRLTRSGTRTVQVLLLSAVAFACVALAAALSLAFGARTVGINEILAGLFDSETTSIGAVVVRERIPRTVLGLIAGAALGMSGALMQAITRNPIADPSVFGVNTGASLFVVCGIAFLNIGSPMQYLLLAFAGAGATAVFVYAIGSMGRGGATPIKLALAGTATSAALSSLVSAVMLPRTTVMDDFRFWQVGRVGGATWEAIAVAAPLLIIGLVTGIVCAPALNALALGDDAATGLGVRTGLLRLTAAFAGVLLCGSVTALAGPIGFVGLMAPHVVRLILGADQRLILPMSAVGGAVILTVADVIGRVAGGSGELEAGVVTAFLGAPVMILIAVKSKVRSL